MNPPYKKYSGSENNLQISVARYLDSLGVLWHHAAGERKTKIRFSKTGRPYTPEGNLLKRKGQKSGVPDCIIYETNKQYIGCAIELKVGYNKPNENQERWLRELAQRGWFTGWSNSLDEVIDWVDEYLKTKGQ